MYIAILLYIIYKQAHSDSTNALVELQKTTSPTKPATARTDPFTISSSATTKMITPKQSPTPASGSSNSYDST